MASIGATTSLADFFLLWKRRQERVNHRVSVFVLWKWNDFEIIKAAVLVCGRLMQKKPNNCCYNTSRSAGVLRACRRCPWKDQMRQDRPIARQPCTRDWLWPSTPWTRLKSVLHVKISLSLSTFVPFYVCYAYVMERLCLSLSVSCMLAVCYGKSVVIYVTNGVAWNSIPVCEAFVIQSQRMKKIFISQQIKCVLRKFYSGL